jgi:hypothetical protein
MKPFASDPAREGRMGIMRVAESVAEAFTASDLVDRTVQRRAVEAVNWGIPAVNFDRLRQAIVRAGATFNQIVYWSRLADWKNQTLTPNPDVIYAMPFISTKDVGPVVLEIPPVGDGTIAGTVTDCWQGALEDVGPSGADKGNGGRYLILPPDYRDEVPSGYLALPSSCFHTYGVLRSVLKGRDEADVTRAVTHARRIQLYPLAQADAPRATTFVDVSDVVFDGTIPYDLRFFQSLDRIVQAEPWQTRDKVMIDVLKSIGIEKGKAFMPNPKLQETLQAAAREARALFTARFETAFPPFYSDRQWAVVAPSEIMETMGTFYEKAETYAVDARALVFYYAFSSAKRPGADQFYLWSMKDSSRRLLDGRSTYRLTLPPRVPARHCWSLVVYDHATHAFIRNLARPGQSSLSAGIQQKSDGSIDLYLGPDVPSGKRSNWIPTAADGQFEVCFRFYGPEQPLFDKTWKLPDIERIS